MSNLERNKKILIDVLNGKTFQEVGDCAGITSARARQICISLLHKLRKPTDNLNPHINSILQFREQRSKWIVRLNNYNG